MKKSLIIFVVLITSVVSSLLFAAQNPDEQRITDKAKEALLERKIILEDVNIIYDAGNKRWEEWGRMVIESPSDKNHGLLPHGVLANKKYQAVYFDFIDDAKKDIWVFIDLETLEVIEVYLKK